MTEHLPDRAPDYGDSDDTHDDADNVSADSSVGTATAPQALPVTRLRRPRAVRWALGVAAAAITGIGLVLMFLLANATNNQALYANNFKRLFIINVVVALLLLLVVGWVSRRLYLRLRQGRFGSRLLIRLAAIFALVGLVPGLLVYGVSYQFVSRSIDSWFDVKFEGALDAGLNFGRATLDAEATNLAERARAVSGLVADSAEATAGLALERVREQLGASDAVLWSGAGQMIASAGASRFSLNPERPTPQQFRQARSERSISRLEGIDDTNPTGAGATAQALVLVLRPGFDFAAEPRFLQVTRALAPALVANALKVQEANREYVSRKLARENLRNMYIGTLTLSLFLAVFGAVLLAVLFGTQLARPLLVLADGVRQVAAGDLRPTIVLRGNDELGGLTRSFAMMTQQLADARRAVEKSMAQLDAARGNLQTILDNLTSGVIVLGADGLIVSTNPGATRVLRAPLAAFEGQFLAAVPGLGGFARDVMRQFEELAAERQQHGLDHWQHAFTLQPGRATQAGDDNGNGNEAAAFGILEASLSRDTIDIVARGAELPGAGRLLVFDDISEIVSAQRAQAWGEVARRLAHEIKNPLTPIQLSAERLQRRLAGKIGDIDQAMVDKSVKTIVDQVDAMKRLVNEFRDYARLPVADLKPLDLNTLLGEVLGLYEAEHGRAGLRVECDPTCPPIRGDAQLVRQVIHNLLQNAQDASEALAAAGGRPAEVLIRTRLSELSQRVRLTVQDSGAGFPDYILKRAFEPYVTTKTKGTGLGLAVVKKIADEHSARIELSNRQLGGQVVGAQVSLSFPLFQTEPPGSKGIAAASTTTTATATSSAPGPTASPAPIAALS